MIVKRRVCDQCERNLSPDSQGARSYEALWAGDPYTADFCDPCAADVLGRIFSALSLPGTSLLPTLTSCGFQKSESPYGDGAPV